MRSDLMIVVILNDEDLWLLWFLHRLMNPEQLLKNLAKQLLDNFHILNLNNNDSVEDPCSSQPCFNHGTCVNTAQGYTCRCADFFTGLNCEKVMRPCKKETCDHGDCVLKKFAPHYKCRCHYPHQGPTCSAVESVCTNNPCKNGGTCLRKLLNKFICVCPNSFRGPFCEMASSECYRNDGLRYRGYASQTVDGHRCLPWDSYLLARETINAFVPDIWQFGIGEHNFCRNPDGAEKPWCYFQDKDEKLKWDLCNVSACQEVPRLNVTTTLKPPNSTASPAPIANASAPFSTCGIRELPSNTRGRIFGGLRSQPGKHPWLASLQLKSPVASLSAGHLCGGTLIAECWILTAAHCVKPLSRPGLWRASLGKLDIQKTETLEQIFDVEKIIIHENFREEMFSLHNDIALIKLKKSKGKCASETRNVKTACLPDRELSPGKICDISGWGMTEKGRTAYLLDASVQVISETNCSDPKSYGKLIDASMLCAGVPEGGIDACQGDSGGPLACELDGQTKVAGVVSWGEKCGVKDKPGVYTHVYRFLPWIENNMKSNP
ncbi:hyaluronan-binding protein 2 [Phyllobates terribilis]|uniref:hyaluronan-binding protein 2 n=1 Tax=Phyllobates terribilis TaxID=111132 RepID=UPI003CCAF7FB